MCLFVSYASIIACSSLSSIHHRHMDPSPPGFSGRSPRLSMRCHSHQIPTRDPVHVLRLSIHVALGLPPPLLPPFIPCHIYCSTPPCLSMWLSVFLHFYYRQSFLTTFTVLRLLVYPCGSRSSSTSITFNHPLPHLLFYASLSIHVALGLPPPLLPLIIPYHIYCSTPPCLSMWLSVFLHFYYLQSFLTTFTVLRLLVYPCGSRSSSTSITFNHSLPHLLFYASLSIHVALGLPPPLFSSIIPCHIYCSTPPCLSMWLSVFLHLYYLQSFLTTFTVLRLLVYPCGSRSSSTSITFNHSLPHLLFYASLSIHVALGLPPPLFSSIIPCHIYCSTPPCLSMWLSVFLHLYYLQSFLTTFTVLRLLVYPCGSRSSSTSITFNHSLPHLLFYASLSIHVALGLPPPLLPPIIPYYIYCSTPPCLSMWLSVFLPLYYLQSSLTTFTVLRLLVYPCGSRASSTSITFNHSLPHLLFYASLSIRVALGLPPPLLPPIIPYYIYLLLLPHLLFYLLVYPCGSRSSSTSITSNHSLPHLLYYASLSIHVALGLPPPLLPSIVPYYIYCSTPPCLSMWFSVFLHLYYSQSFLTTFTVLRLRL